MADNQNQKQTNEMTWREVVELGVTPAPADLATQQEETEDGNEQQG